MRPRLALLSILALAGVAAAAPAARAETASYVPGEVLVHYRGQPGERELKLPVGVTVSEAVDALRANSRVDYANPNYIVRAAVACGPPNDPGHEGHPGCWRRDQWNFLDGDDAPGGVDALGAWRHLKATRHRGGRGVTVAVLDTGVAYRRKGRRFRRDPDLPPTGRFSNPKDFVDGDRLPLDEDGHGTHVTSTIAQATNNRRGLTGLAHGVKLVPIRVLNRREIGTGADVASGIRFAARHRADVINLSLEFGPGVLGCDQIRGVCRAITRALNRGVTIVAAAGNRGRARVAYPAAAKGVIAVGGTTFRGCLADYSDWGARLDLVAPGGGSDKTFPYTGNPLCGTDGPDPFVRQFSLKPAAAAQGNFRRFGFVGLHGTSMAAAHVSAAAALVIARGIVGSDPPAVGHRLECTTDDLGAKNRDLFYGAGLLDASRATDPGFSCAS